MVINNGLIIQWGFLSAPRNYNTQATYAIAFTELPFAYSALGNLTQGNITSNILGVHTDTYGLTYQTFRSNEPNGPSGTYIVIGIWYKWMSWKRFNFGIIFIYED